jgi:hypothetical protein
MLIMKKIKCPYFVFLFFAVSKLSFTQNNPVSNKWFHVGYFGENITHYGLSAGYGYVFWDSFKKMKNSHVQRLYVESNLSFFIHPDNQAVISLMPDLGYRYTKNSSWYIQFTAGAGALRTFYLAKTFEPNGQGGFDEISQAGKWSLGSSFSAGFGKSIGKEKDLYIFTQLRLIQEHSYNQKRLIRPIFQLGFLKHI